MKNFIIAAAAAVLVIAVLGTSYFFYNLRPVGALGDKVEFKIGKGAGFKEIAASLKTAGLIGSENGFKAYLIIFGLAHRLKPGEYLLDRGASAPEIAKILATGPVPDVSVTVVEGMTVREIDELLSLLSVVKPGEIYRNRERLEGYLFPDTYRFFKNSAPEEVTEKFLSNFKEKTSELAMNKESLILASLIEKEVPDYEERLLVAGILLKRFKAGRPLQVDASLCYARMESFKDCYPITPPDLEIDSPYNTYKRKGLPPTPISNPGLKAMEAALNPKESEFWYYLSDPKTKKTVFARTLDEHNRNRVKYLSH